MNSEFKSDIQKQIIKLLLKNEKMNFTGLKNNIQVSKPVLSYHLQILKKEKVVTFEKKGREKHYSLLNTVKHNHNRQVELFSMHYFSESFFSNTSIETSPQNIFNEISNNMTALFLFLFLTSIKTGKNWMSAFDSNELMFNSSDLLCSILFDSNSVHPDDLRHYLTKGWDVFFKKMYTFNKNSKKLSRIDELLEHIEEDFPIEFKNMKGFFDEVKKEK